MRQSKVYNIGQIKQHGKSERKTKRGPPITKRKILDRKLGNTTPRNEWYTRLEPYQTNGQDQQVNTNDVT